MQCGIEIGHGWFLRIWDGWRDTGSAAIKLRQLVQYDCRLLGLILLCMGLFSRFCVWALRCTSHALDIPGVYVFKQRRTKNTEDRGNPAL